MDARRSDGKIMTNILATVDVALGTRSYRISIGQGLVQERSSFADVPVAESCAIVTNTTVGPLFAERLRDALSSIYKRVLVVELPDGERHKDWPTLQRIFDALLEARCDR